jgi:hypothetical protein
MGETASTRHGGHVQVIAGQDDDIEILCNLFDPVKLLKRIVEIGSKKTSHWRISIKEQI